MEITRDTLIARLLGLLQMKDSALSSSTHGLETEANAWLCELSNDPNYHHIGPKFPGTGQRT